MLHIGMDLSRMRLDVHVMDGEGATVEVSKWAPDADGLRQLAQHMAEYSQPVLGVIESINGARFVHDNLELDGWRVEIADAQRAKGLAPLPCKTDRIDAQVLAELSRRDLVPAIWLPPPRVRAAREQARWRLHLVRHRTALKNRIHSALLSFWDPCPVSGLFGTAGRKLPAKLALPEPWGSDVEAAVGLIDVIDQQIGPDRDEAKGRWRQPSVRAVADDCPGGGLDIGVHNRCRTWRYLPVRLAQQTLRLHRTVPQDVPVWGQGPPGIAVQEWAHVLALGLDRGSHPCFQPFRIRPALPAHRQAAGTAARKEGGAGGAGAYPGRGDVVHAHAPGAVRPSPSDIGGGGMNPNDLSSAGRLHVISLVA